MWKLDQNSFFSTRSTTLRNFFLSSTIFKTAFIHSFQVNHSTHPHYALLKYSISAPSSDPSRKFVQLQGKMKGRSINSQSDSGKVSCIDKAITNTGCSTKDLSCICAASSFSSLLNDCVTTLCEEEEAKGENLV